MRLLEGDATCGRDQASLLAALHRCARACGDTETRYARAAADIRSPFLHSLFETYARQRTSFVDELTALLQGLRDEAGTGSPHDAVGPNWRVRPSSSDPGDDALILDDLTRAEVAAQRTYAAVLSCPLEMPAETRAMLTTHHEAIRSALADVWNHATQPRSQR